MADEQEQEGDGGREGKRGLLGRRRLLLALAVFVLLLAAAGVVYWAAVLRGYVSTDDATVEGNQVAVSAQLLGRLVRLNADEGDRVGAGQVLFELDPSGLLAEKAAAEASLKAAQDQRALQAAVLGQSSRDLARASTLAGSGAIPREDYEHRREAFQIAAAQLKAASSQVVQAQGQLELVKTQLNDTKVEAPFDGVVAKRWALPGEVVQPGQHVLSLYELGTAWVAALPEETHLGRIRPGDPVQIRLDAYPHLRLGGKVLFIGAVAASQFSLIPPNNASGNYTRVVQRIPLKISIEASPAERDRLIPGQSATVRIHVGTRR